MREGSSSAAGSGPPPPTRRSLERAQAREQELRSRLAAQVTERRRLWQESERLQSLAGRSGADPRLRGLVERYQATTEDLGRKIEEVRAQLRTQEAVVAERKADLHGV